MDSSPLFVSTKKCTGPCGRILPATNDFFHRGKHAKGGLHSLCKECRSKTRRTTQDPEPAPEGQKRCSMCKQLFRPTPEHFTRSQRTVDGLNAACKVCRYARKNEKRNSPEGKKKSYDYYVEHKSDYRSRERRYYARNRIALGKYPKFIPELKSGEKWCPGCEQIFLATPQFFPRNKNYSDGLHGRCKVCADQYRTQHKERMGPYYKRYREENEERIRNYRHAHRSDKAEYDKRYLRTDQGRLVHLAKSHNRRAHKKAVTGSHTSEQIKEQLKRQRYRCYYAACGFSKFDKRKGRYVYHIEHTFPLSRVVGTDIPANDMSYLVLSCPSCNFSKHDRFPWEWPEGGRLL